MNWNVKVGAEPKKVAILAALLVAAVGFYLYNRNSSSSTAPAPARPVASPGMPPVGQKAAARPARTTVRVTQGGVNQNSREFRPKFGKTQVDPSSVDPILHNALLARLQEVKVEATTRPSLFDFASGPPAPLTAKEPAPIVVQRQPIGPMPPAPPPPPPPQPNAPPIPLKFYGFVNPARVSPKRAFFLAGDNEIIIASEGDVVSKRYKIVRIGVNSAVVEDTQFKGGNTQQTLALEAELTG